MVLEKKKDKTPVGDPQTGPRRGGIMRETYKVQIINEKVEQDSHVVDLYNVGDYLAEIVYELNAGDSVSFRVEKIHE